MLRNRVQNSLNLSGLQTQNIRGFIPFPSKMAFYCVTKCRQKSREPTTFESDELSALLHLFVSVSNKVL